MKLIKVILRPEKTIELKDALHKLGFHGITTKEGLGYGESKITTKQVYRGNVYEESVDAVKRSELEFVASDNKVEKVVETIRKVVATGKGGDGRIYISTLDDAIHISSGDKHLGDSSEEDLSNDISSE
ncbi:MAG: P-II family nitrogen regulator [Candidatus Scalinduaceae bacterium]